MSALSVGLDPKSSVLFMPASMYGHIYLHSRVRTIPLWTNHISVYESRDGAKNWFRNRPQCECGGGFVGCDARKIEWILRWQFAWPFGPPIRMHPNTFGKWESLSFRFRVGLPLLQLSEVNFGALDISLERIFFLRSRSQEIIESLFQRNDEIPRWSKKKKKYINFTKQPALLCAVFLRYFFLFSAKRLIGKSAVVEWRVHVATATKGIEVYAINGKLLILFVGSNGKKSNRNKPFNRTYGSPHPHGANFQYSWRFLRRAHESFSIFFWFFVQKLHTEDGCAHVALSRVWVKETGRRRKRESERERGRERGQYLLDKFKI